MQCGAVTYSSTQKYTKFLHYSRSIHEATSTTLSRMLHCKNDRYVKHNMTSKRWGERESNRQTYLSEKRQINIWQPFQRCFLSWTIVNRPAGYKIWVHSTEQNITDNTFKVRYFNNINTYCNAVFLSYANL